VIGLVRFSEGDVANWRWTAGEVDNLRPNMRRVS
jgi:hypothetical protein